MQWWGWIALGAILLGSELSFIDAQFYLVFVGAAALAVGLLAIAGLAAEPWLQWLIFALLAVISMLTFRRSLYERMRARLPVSRDGIVGQTIEVGTAIAPQASARVEFRGSTWNCLNGGEQTIGPGTRARIVRVDGITLIVNPEH